MNGGHGTAGSLMGASQSRPLGALGAVRAFGVMLGGSAVFGRSGSGEHGERPSRACLSPTAESLVRGWQRRNDDLCVSRPPWHLRWGAEPGESMPLPDDDLFPEGGSQILHAITIDAPAEAVWPWVAQLRQDRGGMYSYEWLENLAGCEMRNADEINPEWQDRDLGETLFLHPSGGLEVTLFEPGRALGIRNWGTIVLVSQGPDRTRLLVRGRIPRGLLAAGYALLMEIPHFIMERRMLIGIKQRAELGGASSTTSPETARG